MAYLPIDDKGDFEFIIASGIGRAELESSVSVSGTTVDVSDDAVGWRVGGGFQYRVNKNVSLRVMGRYQSYSFEINGVEMDIEGASIGGGINFNF